MQLALNVHGHLLWVRCGQPGCNGKRSADDLLADAIDRSVDVWFAAWVVHPPTWPAQSTAYYLCRCSRGACTQRLNNLPLQVAFT